MKENNNKKFLEELAKSEAMWKPYYDQRDQLLDRHGWVKDLLDGGGGELVGYHPQTDNSRVKSKMNPSQKILEKTSYNHPIENEKFVHFTSFQAFKEIINSGIIRLHNPHFGNDPNEVLFGSKVRYETKATSDNALNKLFILSLNTESSKNDLTMWKLYGNDGFGVGLIFELTNPIENWNNWYFGKVLYGEIDELTQLDKFHKDYKQVQTEMGNPPLLDIDIVPIYAFHKSGLFHSENEVRLLHYNNDKLNSYGNQISSDGMFIQNTLNTALKETKYLEYPFYWLQNVDKIKRSEIDQYHPKMILKEIVLGYRFSDKDLSIIKNYSSDLIYRKFHWSNSGMKYGAPKVSISELQNYFK
jgi:hypothetical protein